MFRLFKRLLAWLLEKLVRRIPKSPTGQQDGYFDKENEETLQNEIRRILLNTISSLREIPQKNDSAEPEKISFPEKLKKIISGLKDRAENIPRWVKLLVLTTLPICVIYIIFYALLVTSPDINKEEVFRFSKGKPLVRIGYVQEWPTSQVITSLISEAMDNNLNVDITTKPVSQNKLADLWQMLLTDRIDVTPSVWLPDTHAAFVRDAGNSVSDLGIWLKGARLGLVVPDYMQANSIEELTKENSGGIIFGIDQSSKLIHMTRRALELYGLKDFRIIAKSDKYMVSRLEEALKKKENIIVTAWTPHWIFGEWKLKMLADPLNVYGKEEGLHIFVTSDFKENFPDICAFLGNIKLSLKEFSDIMASARHLNSPAGAASKWLTANRQTALEWDREEE